MEAFDSIVFKTLLLSPENSSFNEASQFYVVIGKRNILTKAAIFNAYAVSSLINEKTPPSFLRRAFGEMVGPHHLTKRPP